jgi:hypothetical protein
VMRMVPPAVALVGLLVAGVPGTLGGQEGCAPAGAVSVSAVPLAAEQMTRELLVVPGTIARTGVASPTRAPWVNTNGARILRAPGGKYRYELPEGKAALAAAEALAYGADAVLQIAPADLPAACRVLAFPKDVPPSTLPTLADFGVVDDGTPATAEVMNLLVRRNLLFQPVSAPQPRFPMTVVLGTPEYPVAEAANPSALALKIRRRLTDERRTLRIFGSEVVIGRLTGDGTRARLHLLNYGGREITGLRVRVRGAYRAGDTYALGQEKVALTDATAAGGAIEFSIPLITTYVIVDLR